MQYTDWIAIHFNSGFINMTKFKLTALMFVFISLIYIYFVHCFNRLLVFMYHLDSILKSRNFANKGPSIQGSEKVMAPHSSTLAWKIPWMEEPGRLQSMGS